MLNELTVFTNPTFGEIRGMTIDGEPWLVGKDVAAALGYTNPRKAIIDHVDPEDKGVTKCDTLGGMQEMTIINESGLYSLILSSKLPAAKQFKRWVTAEVLPSIRKNGGYIAGQENLTDAELLAKAVLVAQRTIEERTARIAALENKIEQDAPKVQFADAVSASPDSILIGEMAKLLKKNGVDTGEKRLFAWLRENGYLIKRVARDRNTPTQWAVEQGYLTVKEVTFKRLGKDAVKITPLVTGKGQRHLLALFAGNVHPFTTAEQSDMFEVIPA